MRLLLVGFACAGIAVRAAASPASCVQGLRTHFSTFYPNMAAACAGGNSSERAVLCLQALRDGIGRTEGATGRPVITGGFWTLAGACAGGATAKRAESCLDFMKRRWAERNPSLRYPKELAYACAGDRTFDDAWSCADGVMARRGFEPLHLSACQGTTTNIQAVQCLDAIRTAGFQSPIYAGACGGSTTGPQALECIRGIRTRIGLLNYIPMLTWACSGGQNADQAMACVGSREGTLRMEAERDYVMACVTYPGAELAAHAAADAKVHPQ